MRNASGTLGKGQGESGRCLEGGCVVLRLVRGRSDILDRPRLGPSGKLLIDLVRCHWASTGSTGSMPHISNRFTVWWLGCGAVRRPTGLSNRSALLDRPPYARRRCRLARPLLVLIAARSAVVVLSLRSADSASISPPRRSARVGGRVLRCPVVRPIFLRRPRDVKPP